MMGLSDSERISMIRSAVLMQYTRVTDGQTDRQTELAWHIRAIAYMLSRVKIGKTYELGKFLLRVMKKKSGELRSTNYLELHVSLDPLKCT